MLLIRKVFIRTRNHGPNVWAAVEQLIRLLDSANIPVCGGAFGLASEIIDMINAVEESQKECSMLLDLAVQYARTILNFVDAMQPDYICASEDCPAVLAREGIQNFQKELERIVPVIKALSRKGRIKQALLRRGMADDIKECELQLKRSHEAFKTTLLITLIATTNRLKPPPTNQMENDLRQLKVAGAAVVGHDELGDHREAGHQENATGIWTDLFDGTVRNKRSLLKIYSERSGGISAFLRDLKRLGQCPTGLPRIRAYCWESTTPFIVFKAESIKPLRVHLLDLATTLDVNIADRRIWKTIADLNAVARAVSRHCQGINVTSLSVALEDARIDHNGEISLAPEWSDDPGLSLEGGPGPAELTRDMLEKFLMGDHRFHHLSCISFTFGAATWNYMTRKDVLNLSDATSAMAHLCAYDGSALPSGTEIESYETWTQCSCVGGHMDQHAVHRESIIPSLSTFVNQTFRLRLSSRVKNAVSDLINMPNFQTTHQNNANSDTQECDTLSPKVWALLLIADTPLGEVLSGAQEQQAQERSQSQRGIDLLERGASYTDAMVASRDQIPASMLATPVILPDIPAQVPDFPIHDLFIPPPPFPMYCKMRGMPVPRVVAVLAPPTLFLVPSELFLDSVSVEVSNPLLPSRFSSMSR